MSPCHRVICDRLWGAAVALRQILLGLITGLVLGCSGLGVLTWPALPSVRQAEALDRWAQRPFERYQMSLRDNGGANPCEFSVEVRGETVTRVIRNTCAPRIRWTVNFLFRRIEALQRASSDCVKASQGYSCLCRSAIEMSVQYDSVHGYPRALSSWMRWQPNWSNGNYWRYAIAHAQLPSCDAPFAESRRTMLVSLTPVQ